MKRRFAAQGVIFIHVPKNAGTSINEALYGRGMPHLRASDVRRALGSEFDEMLSFCVARDPLDRAVSSYLFAQSGGTPEVPMRSAREIGAAALASFDAFVFEWLSQIDVARADFVFHPQYLYACQSGRIILDEVLRYEHLDADLGMIEQRIGRRLLLPRRNETRPGGTRGLISVDAATRRAVERIYAQDYEVFRFPSGVTRRK